MALQLQHGDVAATFLHIFSYNKNFKSPPLPLPPPISKNNFVV
jgi:hypothetical protein